MLQRACTGCFLVCHLHAQLAPVSWVEHLTSGDRWREPDRSCLPREKHLQRGINVCHLDFGFKLKIIRPLSCVSAFYFTFQHSNFSHITKNLFFFRALMIYVGKQPLFLINKIMIIIPSMGQLSACSHRDTLLRKKKNSLIKKQPTSHLYRP